MIRHRKRQMKEQLTLTVFANSAVTYYNNMLRRQQLVCTWGGVGRTSYIVHRRDGRYGNR